MTKKDLLERLQQVLHNFQFGMALFCFFPAERWAAIRDVKIPFEGEGVRVTIDLSDIVDRLRNESEMEQMHDQYERCLRRALLAESFEVVAEYCEKSRQRRIFETEPWYQFARLVRNAVSHKSGGNLEWPKPPKNKPGKKPILSAVWRHRTLLPSMEGEEIQFSSAEAIALFEDLRLFANSKLA